LKNVAKFFKMTVFERRGDRVIVLWRSENRAGSQAVIGMLKQRCVAGAATTNLLGARTIFDAAMLVSDAMRYIERSDGEDLQKSELNFNAAFIVGGQIGANVGRKLPDGALRGVIVVVGVLAIVKLLL